MITLLNVRYHTRFYFTNAQYSNILILKVFVETIFSIKVIYVSQIKQNCCADDSFVMRDIDATALQLFLNHEREKR